MFARVRITSGMPSKVEDGIRHFRENVVASYKDVTGFEGAYLLVNRKTGKLMGITLWESAAMSANETVKLYITPGSPYARMARIVVLEKGLENRVEIVGARTRVADSPYYRINPSGRVPYLVTGDGVGLEESALICAYLDHLDGKPVFDLPGGDQRLEARRLEALARSILDGLSVWGREILRPENERSPTVIRHETDRARRMADVWEHEIDHPLMNGALNMIQITLACALGLGARNPGFLWRPGHPKLARWFDRIAARPSFAATAPPGA